MVKKCLLVVVIPANFFRDYHESSAGMKSGWKPQTIDHMAG